MARIFTTPEAEQAAKAWIHDLTIAAGIRTQNQRTNYSNYISRMRAGEAKKVCDELINRNFENIDSEIRSLSQVAFYKSLTDKHCKSSYPIPGVIAKYLVYASELFNLYWDDTIRTPYEIDAFKSTLLGEAVYKYKRYISATASKAKARANTPAANGAQIQTQAQPKNNYKQTGPQSGNVRALIGTPNNKVYADGPISYRIEGDKLQSNVPRVFIKPLSASGAIGNTNKIFISSGNGYTDCTCYFDDLNDAQNFLARILPDVQKLIQDKRAIAGITNLHVAKVKSDPNGYFLVDTEYGPCAISAKTLNEALAEELEEDTSWERATKDYSKEELEELHTWMRRG